VLSRSPARSVILGCHFALDHRFGGDAATLVDPPLDVEPVLHVWSFCS
jgi:hypothetical protein